ncbi:hypothetical protein [Meridianimarinicoccus marinus]
MSFFLKVVLLQWLRAGANERLLSLGFTDGAAFRNNSRAKAGHAALVA